MQQGSDESRDGAGLRRARREVGVAVADVPLPRSPILFGVVARTGGTSLLTRKDELITFSHIIEDECDGDLEGAHLFGSFQRARFYESARHRWEQLARQAASAFVFASFAEQQTGAPAYPVEVAVGATNPLRQEWAIVVDRPRGPIVMSAVERPGQEGVADRDRLFDSTWTTNPAAVRKAARVCALTAATADAPGARTVQFELAGDDAPADPAARVRAPGARPPARGPRRLTAPVPTAPARLHGGSERPAQRVTGRQAPHLLPGPLAR